MAVYTNERTNEQTHTHSALGSLANSHTHANNVKQTNCIQSGKVASERSILVCSEMRPQHTHTHCVLRLTELNWAVCLTELETTATGIKSTHKQRSAAAGTHKHNAGSFSPLPPPPSAFFRERH